MFVELFEGSLTNGSYKVTGDVARAWRDDKGYEHIVRFGFPVQGEFATKELAIKAGIAAGRKRIEAGFEFA